MPKRLYYSVAAWFIDRVGGTETTVRHSCLVASSEAEARGLVMQTLDEKWPEYKQGRKFNVTVTEIPAELIRQCVE